MKSIKKVFLIIVCFNFIFFSYQQIKVEAVAPVVAGFMKALPWLITGGKIVEDIFFDDDDINVIAENMTINNNGDMTFNIDDMDIDDVNYFNNKHGIDFYGGYYLEDFQLLYETNKPYGGGMAYLRDGVAFPFYFNSWSRVILEGEVFSIGSKRYIRNYLEVEFNLSSYGFSITKVTLKEDAKELDSGFYPETATGRNILSKTIRHFIPNLVNINALDLPLRSSSSQRSKNITITNEIINYYNNDYDTTYKVEYDEIVNNYGKGSDEEIKYLKKNIERVASS